MVPVHASGTWSDNARGDGLLHDEPSTWVELRYANGWVYFDVGGRGEQERLTLREGRARFAVGQRIEIGRSTEFRGGYDRQGIQVNTPSGVASGTQLRFKGWILVRLGGFAADDEWRSLEPASTLHSQLPDGGVVMELATWASARRGPCDGENADPWVAATAERARNHDGLLHFAIGKLGQPVECEGRVTDEFDSESFGTVLFRFSEGATFELETMPPSVSIVTLRDSGGFDEPAEVLEALRSYTVGRGLSIVWEDPERSAGGDEVIEQFWDPEPGLNASASLTWSSGVLVSVRVSLAR